MSYSKEMCKKFAEMAERGEPTPTNWREVCSEVEKQIEMEFEDHDEQEEQEEKGKEEG